MRLYTYIYIHMLTYTYTSLNMLTYAFIYVYIYGTPLPYATAKGSKAYYKSNKQSSFRVGPRMFAMTYGLSVLPDDEYVLMMGRKMKQFE